MSGEISGRTRGAQNITQPARTHVQSQRARLAARLAKFLPPLFLAFAAALVVWQYQPQTRALTDDPAIFAYLAQVVADGRVPHQTAFNEQSSLTFFIGGLAMRLGDVIGLHRLLAFRAASLICFIGVVLLTYELTRRMTRVGWIGFFAGIILLGMEGFGARAATALEPKVLMLVFGLASLLALQKRKWFWAGALGGAAGLVWQLAWGYLVVALLLAFFQGSKKFPPRARAFLLTLGAAGMVLTFYTLYFVARGAQVEMFQQTFLSLGMMHAVAAKGIAAQLQQAQKFYWLGFPQHIIFLFLGIGGLGAWLLAHLRPWEWNRLLRRAGYFFLCHCRSSGTLLVTFGFIGYGFTEFQNYPDWFPLLPYLALFAGWFVWMTAARVLQFIKVPPRARVSVYSALAALLLFASAAHAFISVPPVKRITGITWQEQARVMTELNQRLPADAPMWVIGKAELLFFMRRHNLNKYIYLIGNADGAADAFEPGGFAQVLDSTLAQKPALLVLARLQKRKTQNEPNFRALERATENFVRLRRCKAMGEGTFYVRADLADTLFPANGQGCVRR